MSAEARRLLDDLVWNATFETKLVRETLSILESHVYQIIMRGIVTRELENWAEDQKNMHQAKASKIKKILSIVDESISAGIEKLHKHHSHIARNYEIVAGVIHSCYSAYWEIAHPTV